MSDACCICQVPARNGKPIFLEKVGNPPKIISDLVLNLLLQDLEHRFEFGEDSLVCKKCTEKLTRFYKTTLIAEEIKTELLELMQQAYGEDMLFVELDKKNAISNSLETTNEEAVINEVIVLNNNEEVLTETEILPEQEVVHTEQDFVKMEYEVLEEVEDVEEVEEFLSKLPAKKFA